MVEWTENADNGAGTDGTVLPNLAPSESTIMSSNNGDS